MLTRPSLPLRQKVPGDLGFLQQILALVFLLGRPSTFLLLQQNRRCESGKKEHKWRHHLLYHFQLWEFWLSHKDGKGERPGRQKGQSQTV